jgi:uncharacterized membrane protein
VIERARRGPLGLPLLLAALVATGVAGYLSAVRLAGETAVCGPSHGCATVASSEFSEVLGIPVAFLGVAFSLVLVALAAAWWRRADRRILLAAYGLLLLGTLVVAYLTYVELFVIAAVCVWCVAFSIAVVVALVIAGLAMARSSRPDPA